MDPISHRTAVSTCCKSFSFIHIVHTTRPQQSVIKSTTQCLQSTLIIRLSCWMTIVSIQSGGITKQHDMQPEEFTRIVREYIVYWNLNAVHDTAYLISWLRIFCTSLQRPSSGKKKKLHHKYQFRSLGYIRWMFSKDAFKMTSLI